MERCLLNPNCKKSGRLYRIHSSSMFTRVVIFQRPRFVCREFGQRKYISLPMNRQFSKSKNSGKSIFIFLLFCIKNFKKTKRVKFSSIILFFIKKQQQKIDRPKYWKMPHNVPCTHPLRHEKQGMGTRDIKAKNFKK